MPRTQSLILQNEHGNPPQPPIERGGYMVSFEVSESKVESRVKSLKMVCRLGGFHLMMSFMVSIGFMIR